MWALTGHNRPEGHIGASVKTSDNIGEIAAALAAAQAQMGAALKDSTNPHFKSRYADLASVMEATRPYLAAHGIAIVQMAETLKETGEVVVTTALLHKSGQIIAGRLSATCKDLSPQPVGSAITYLRRYGLMAIAGIAPDDDDGEAAMGRQYQQPERREPSRPAEPPPEPDEVAAAIAARCKQLGCPVSPARAESISRALLNAMDGDTGGALYSVQSGKRDTRLREKAAEAAE